MLSASPPNPLCETSNTRKQTPPAVPPKDRTKLAVLLEILRHTVSENRNQEAQLWRLISTISDGESEQNHEELQPKTKEGKATLREGQKNQAELEAELARKTHDLEVCRTVLAETRKDMAKLRQDNRVFKILLEGKEEKDDDGILKPRCKPSKSSSIRKRKTTIRSSLELIPPKRSKFGSGDNESGVEDLDLFADPKPY